MTNRKRPEFSTLRQPTSAPLLDDIHQLIIDTRVRVAAAVNASLTLLYWQIGQRIRKDVLQEKWAEYGQEIVPTLSAQLVLEFGQGFSSHNLARMVQFACIAGLRLEDWA